MLDFEQECPARGRGRPRPRYNFLTFIESWKAATSSVKEKTKKMMDYIDFTVYFRDKRLMKQDAIDRLWYAMLNNLSVRKDQEGMDENGGKGWRLEVVTGDFRYDRESLTYAKEMQGEILKKKNPDEKTIDACFEDLSHDHASHSHSFFKGFRDNTNLSSEGLGSAVQILQGKQEGSKPKAAASSKDAAEPEGSEGLSEGSKGSGKGHRQADSKLRALRANA